MQGLRARLAAAQILHSIANHGSRLEEAFDGSCQTGTLRGESARDKAFARAILATALRRKGLIDEMLKLCLRRPPPGFIPEVLAVAIAQLFFMDTPRHAAISLAVESARSDSKTMHLTGLVNGILRGLVTDSSRLQSLSMKPGINQPKWLFARWQRHYGSSIAKQISAALIDEPPLDISVVGCASVWADRLNADLRPSGTVRMAKIDRPIDQLPGYAEGSWWVQDEAASFPVKLLGDISGLQVLDACAAPGGKTAQLISKGAHVTALDISQSRLTRLGANLARLGMRANLVLADARSYFEKRDFDAILLDAPCSATGTLRRHPDVAWHRSEQQIRDLASLQKSMLEQAAKLLKPGGQVVFSTCSLEPEEGEMHIQKLPAGLKLEPIDADELSYSNCWQEPGIFRSLPQYGMDGFFAARLRRS